MRAPPQALSPLVRRLEAIRVRLQLRRGLELYGWVLLAAPCAWTALRLWNYLPAPDVSDQAALGVVAGVLGLGLVGVLLFLWRTAPALGRVAILAEQKLGLKERLSTSLEIAAAPPSPGYPPMHLALFKDTARFLRHLDPARAVPLAPPRASPFVLGAVVVAVLAGLLPQPARQGLVASSPTPSAEQAQVVPALKRLILEVQQDAERTSDPYLRAEARNLEQLRSQLQQGKIGGEVLRRELNSSLARLGQSYGIAPEGQAGSGSVNPASEPRSSDPQPSGASSAAGSARAAGRSLEQFAQAVQAQRQSAALKAPANPDELSRECFFIEGYECLTSAQVAKLQEEFASAGARVQAKAPDGGTPGGSGDKGGQGAQAKLGGRQELQPRAAARQVVLPRHAPSSSQRRIQISAPTQLVRALEPSQGTAGAWRLGEEAPVPQGLQGLGPEARAAVGLYFARQEE